MKVVFSGLESSGKSLKLAMVVVEIAYRNAKWREKSGQVRPIYSNLEFSKEFREFCENELVVPIHYYTNLHELIQVENADVIIDELGNYFDSRLWADLSLDVRRWLTQGAKTGIEMYGTAQDFAQVDKAFRRLVNHLFHITKLAGSRRPSPTKPPVKHIWGWCSIKELDPQQYDEEKSKFQGNIFSLRWFFIRKEFCSLFDTTQKIVRSKPMPFRHLDRECELNNCAFHKIIHV